jgi:hypothetical protein
VNLSERPVNGQLKHKIGSVEINVDNKAGWEDYDFGMYLGDYVRTVRQEREQLIQKCREAGARMLHPNDGWVGRDNGKPVALRSTYPDFNDNPKVGDLIALGFSIKDIDLFRVVAKDGNTYALEFFSSLIEQPSLETTLDKLLKIIKRW